MSIEIKCTVEGHENESVQFKSEGWKFKHLRIWQGAILQNTMMLDEFVEFLTERIESWNLTGYDGKPVPFEPGIHAFDELPPEISPWITTAYHDAYLIKVTPAKNS